MTGRVLLLTGTNKGAFVMESDGTRRDWRLSGPFCDGWPIHHVIGDPDTGAIYAAGGNPWFGIGVWKSTDAGATWTRTPAEFSFGEGEEDIETIWSLGHRNGTVYAGTKPAGLFESHDGGASFAHVAGLRAHPTRKDWQGGGAGLILHSIAPHPRDDQRLWVGMSAVGVFGTEDGGATWEPRNSGTRADFMPEGQRLPEFGQCVHSLVRAPGAADLLYQQNHCGMYRSANGGRSWESIEAGLPSTFGFPVAVHPRKPGTLWFLPLNGDMAGRYPPDARLAVWRSRDGGNTWEDLRRGLPQENVYVAVLRQAMASDTRAPAGIYFGTNSGDIYASEDEGDNWREIARHLPMVLSVETLSLNA